MKKLLAMNFPSLSTKLRAAQPCPHSQQSLELVTFEVFALGVLTVL